MILIDDGGGGAYNLPEPTPTISAYRECYARCIAEGKTIEQCQLECDPAFTGYDDQRSIFGVPFSGYRIEGPGFLETFGAGVGEDVRNLPATVGGAAGQLIEGATGGSIQSLLILGLIGLGLVLALRLT